MPYHKESGVYRIVNSITGRQYIGSSINIRYRKFRHFRDLRLGIHSNRFLQREFNKYGETGFLFETLLYCDPEDCVLYEQMVMDALIPELNLKPLATNGLGQKRSDEFREQCRLRMTGKHILHTQETREKISASLKGRKHSAERIAAIMAGKAPITEETRSKMRASRLGKKDGPCSEERKEHIRQARLGKPHPQKKHPPYSEKSKEKMRQSRLAYLTRQRSIP